MNPMSLRIVYIFTFIILACIAVPSKKQHNVNSDVKLSQIRDLSSKSKGNVITLDDATYSYYAITKPRPYTLIVFLTAAHPKFKCGICKQIDSELTVLADSYAKLMINRKEEKDIFFIRLDYESSQKVFNSYAVSSVPLIFHLSPLLSTDNLKPGSEYEILHRDKYTVPSDPDAESMALFLADRTNVTVDIERTMLFVYLALVIIFIVIAALVQPVINSLPFWLRLVQLKPLWIAVSFGVYTCAISGFIFDIIRSPQMYYANPQTGQIMFFYPQAGNQFVVEGFVIGFLNLCCAISLILITTYVPKIKENQNRTVFMVCGIIAFAFCFRMIRSLYIMKNPWYGKHF